MTAKARRERPTEGKINATASLSSLGSDAIGIFNLKKLHFSQSEKGWSRIGAANEAGDGIIDRSNDKKMRR